MFQTGVKAEAHTETFPAGSVRVPTDQSLGELVVAMLEPESTDSLFNWGFFPEILQRTEYIEGYVVAPYGRANACGRPGAQKGVRSSTRGGP